MKQKEDNREPIWIDTADQEIERLHKQDGKGTAPPYFMSED